MLVASDSPDMARDRAAETKERDWFYRGCG